MSFYIRYDIRVDKEAIKRNGGLMGVCNKTYDKKFKSRKKARKFLEKYGWDSSENWQELKGLNGRIGMIRFHIERGGC